MINIEKTFSRRVAAAIKMLPSLLAIIDSLNAYGIKVKMQRHTHGAHYCARTKTIYIGERGSIRYKLAALAHEAVHAIGRVTLDPVPGKDVRGYWSALQCRNEAHAMIAEFPIIRELQKLGHKFSPEELVFFNAYKRGGFQAVLQLIRKTITSNTGDLYPEYYRLSFDEFQADHLKRCGPWNKKCKPGVDHRRNLDNRILYSNREFKEQDDLF